MEKSFGIEFLSRFHISAILVWFLLDKCRTAIDFNIDAIFLVVSEPNYTLNKKVTESSGDPIFVIRRVSVRVSWPLLRLDTEKQ